MNSNLKKTEPGSAQKLILLLPIIIVFYICLVIYAAALGPTIYQDDHWYMSDLRTFVTTGKMQTNQVFPVQIFHNDFQPPKVIHNLPLMYAAIPFVLLFGAYWGWIVTNLIYTLLTLWLFLLILKEFKASELHKLLYTGLFLFWIMTVHSAAHPLAEAGVLFFIVLLTYILLKSKDRYLDFALAGLLSVVVILNRPSFIGLFFLLPVYFILQAEPDRQRWSKILYFLGILTTGLVIGYALLPQFRGSIMTPLKMPDGQAMLHFFTKDPIPFKLNVWLEKTLSAFRLQFTGRGPLHLVFVAWFNLLIVFFLIRRPQSAERNLYRIITMFLLIYLATLLWFQYQTRFLHTVMPFLLLWLILKFPKAGKALPYYFMLAVFALFNLAGDIYYAQNNRKEAIITAQIETAYTYIRDNYRPQDAIIFSGSSKLAPWVFHDNPYVLMVDAKLLSSEDLLELVEKTDSKWMICESNSALLDSLGAFLPKHVTDLPEPMSEFSFYSLSKF